MQDNKSVEIIDRLSKFIHLGHLPHLIPYQVTREITTQFLLTANNKKQDRPQLIGIGGGPGSGKSFMYEQMQADGKLPTHAVLYDPDLVMQSMPQYRKDTALSPEDAFQKWELPARQLANDILLQALLCRYHIIYIRSFGLSDSLHVVHAIKELGYQFDIHIMTCNLDIALARAKQREIVTKRYISPETINQRHQAVLDLMPKIINLADCYSIYENNINGCLPILVKSVINSETLDSHV